MILLVGPLPLEFVQGGQLRLAGGVGFGYRVLRGHRVPEGDAAAEAVYRGMGGRPLHGTTLYQRGLR